MSKSNLPYGSDGGRPFPNPSLLNPINKDQHNHIKGGVDVIEKAAKEHGLASNYEFNLKHMQWDYIHILRTSLSSGPGSRLSLLKIELVLVAKLVKVQKLKYLLQREDSWRNLRSTSFCMDLLTLFPLQTWPVHRYYSQKQVVRFDSRSTLGLLRSSQLSTHSNAKFGKRADQAQGLYSLCKVWYVPWILATPLR